MNTPTQNKEREPTLPGWELAGRPLIEDRRRVLGCTTWRNGSGVFVVSALEVAKYPVGELEGPQWHISISKGGRRPKDKDLRGALRAFGMVGAEEDNHHPGAARHFWLPVDPAFRVGCECKEEEELITEPDGFQWTNPREGACRGCALQALTGRPCTLHRAVGQPR